MMVIPTQVIDSSDILIQVLDVPDTVGTRSLHIEKYIKRLCVRVSE